MKLFLNYYKITLKYIIMKLLQNKIYSHGWKIYQQICQG